MPYQVDANGMFVRDPAKSAQENAADYRAWYEDRKTKVTKPAPATKTTSTIPTTQRNNVGQVEVPFIVPASPLSGPGNRSPFNPPISTTPVVGDPGIVPPSNAPIAPIAGFVPPNVGSATAPVTGPDMWRRQESSARAAAAGPGSSSVTTPMPPALMGPQPQSNQQGQAPAKQPPLDPLKVMSDQPTQQKLAKAGVRARVLPPQHAQPQPQSPVPAAPATAQQQPVAGILPTVANSVFPNFFGGQPQQSFDLQGTPATAVGDTNATAMQLDPANLAVLSQSLGSGSPASAAMNPAAIQALARMGQGVVQSNNPQFVPANPRPVEMPGRASVAIGNDADKILALILARSQGQAVPGLSQLVGKL